MPELASADSPEVFPADSSDSVPEEETFSILAMAENAISQERKELDRPNFQIAFLLIWTRES